MRILAGFTLCVLAGCAAAPHVAGYRPVVDPTGHDPAQIDADVSHCHSMARQTPAWHSVRNAGKHVAANALVGALVGAALGAALGDGLTGYQGSITRFGAGVGAAHGAVHGGASVGAAIEAYRNVVRSCMAHRGYLVYD